MDISKSYLILVTIVSSVFYFGFKKQTKLSNLIKIMYMLQLDWGLLWLNGRYKGTISHD